MGWQRLLVLVGIVAVVPCLMGADITMTSCIPNPNNAPQRLDGAGAWSVSTFNNESFGSVDFNAVDAFGTIFTQAANSYSQNGWSGTWDWSMNLSAGSYTPYGTLNYRQLIGQSWYYRHMDNNSQTVTVQ